KEASSEASKRELETIRKILQDVESRKDRVIATYDKYRSQLFNCSIQLYRVELLRAYRLIEEERSHLGQVHDYLKSVREQDGTAAQSERLKELNGQHFSSAKFDRLRADGYNMSKYDFLMRLKSRVESDI